MGILGRKSATKYKVLPKISIEDEEIGILSSEGEQEDGLLSPSESKSRSAKTSTHYLPRWAGSRKGVFRRIKRVCVRLCRSFVFVVVLVLGILLSLQLLLNNSYNLKNASRFQVPKEETVFIAANIVDKGLINGAWGEELLRLVERIGSERVFVSIYGGPKMALMALEEKLRCGKSIIAEEDEPLDRDSIPRTELPDGEKRIKRITWLAEVRNKALAPLKELNKKGKRFDKLLFINDVVFEAEGAERLLWGTNLVHGKPAYKAVCAADFVTSWKFYDTFATRDAEGYSIGVPIFPWFGTAGEETSRNDVLAQKEAVRVKSCWGGMVAFDGVYFQTPENNTSTEEIEGGKERANQNGLGTPSLPLTFRSEPEPFWDSSECCLIHADIMALPSPPSTYPASLPPPSDPQTETGIFINPYVRVSYSPSTQKWIGFVKRFERLASPLQRIINYFARLPRWNYRRTEREGDRVADRVWVAWNETEKALVEGGSGSDGDERGNEFGSEDATWQGIVDRSKSVLGLSTIPAVKGRNVEKRTTLKETHSKEYWRTQGRYVDTVRVANRGGYCGVRLLLVVKEGVWKKGDGNWDNLMGSVPPLDV